MSEILETLTAAQRCYQLGNTARAEQLCQRVLQIDDKRPQAWHLAALVAHRSGNHTTAVERIQKAIDIEPANAEWLTQAAEIFRVADMSGRAEGAARRALEINPALHSAHNNLGLILQHADLLDEAETCFLKAIELNPLYPRAHYNLGNTYLLQHRYDEALRSLGSALKLQPEYPRAWNAIGLVHREIGNYRDAHRAIAKALEQKPRDIKARLNLAGTLQAQARNVEAVRCYREILQRQPRQFETLCRLSRLLHRGTQWEASLEAAERAVEVQPDSAEALANLLYLRSFVCDWRDRAKLRQRSILSTREALSAGRRSPIWPAGSLRLIEDPELQLQIARQHGDNLTEATIEFRRGSPFEYPRSRSDGRLRIAYMSGGFRNYPFGHLSRRLYALHDRSKFEVFAYSLEPDDGSDYRRGIEADCDRFLDVAGWSPSQIARRVSDDGIHILVAHDTLLTSDYVDCLAMRPAPLQVSWLYPGTYGAEFIDYIVADRVVIPQKDERYFSEQVLFLPHTHYITDNAQEAAAEMPQRSECGLPEDAFVFCCFNLASKIEPEMFEVWMRILLQVPASVLWLLSNLEIVQKNLRREAERRGVPGDRIVFAGRRPKPQHLARHRLADLFLDTAPYNAHTTAVDAMGVGLPLITCPGTTFASRVAASIVSAAGMPELIVAGMGEFEKRAVHLAQHPEELSQLRERLTAQRDSCPLFDTPGFVRKLETAWSTIWARFEASLPPQSLSID